MIHRLYPGGKKKAFHISYDDGVEQDIPFINLLNRYGIKGTFHLNSGLMESEFSWIHPSGRVIKRLPPEAVAEVYAGHEVASHTLTHPSLYDLSEEEVLYQMGKDKENLERYWGKEVLGFAVPFDYYDDGIARCAQKCGFAYARTSQESYSYVPPTDVFHWAAGSYHVMPGFLPFVEGFFETEEELALCQIVGHSYDLDTENLWETMERILQRVAREENIISMTHIQLVTYLNAMYRVQITEAGIYNSTDQELWFSNETRTFSVKPGQTWDFSIGKGR